MSGDVARRGFLRGLVSLPLIGGGVTLIGEPTAAAEPVTKQLLQSYGSWLWGERCRLMAEMYPDTPPGLRGGVDVSNPGYWFHHHVPDSAAYDAGTARDRRLPAAERVARHRRRVLRAYWLQLGRLGSRAALRKAMRRSVRLHGR